MVGWNFGQAYYPSPTWTHDCLCNSFLTSADDFLPDFLSITLAVTWQTPCSHLYNGREQISDRQKNKPLLAVFSLWIRLNLTSPVSGSSERWCEHKVENSRTVEIEATTIICSSVFPRQWKWLWNLGGRVSNESDRSGYNLYI